MRRIAAVVALALIAATVGIAAPANAGDVAASGTTTITMRVANCEGCFIRPSLTRVDADGKSVGYYGKAIKVRNGVAVLRVPTSKTPGMSFRINGPTRVPVNYAPVLVVQYKGYAPGTVVTKAQAKAAKQASACWEGTSSSSVTLSVRAARVLVPKFPPDGTKTLATFGWFVPTAKAPGNFGPTYKGVIGTQEAGWVCDAG